MSRRAGLALGAIGLIGLITASWWALALWPMPAETPVWLVRARVACFGSAMSGLPDAGGWLLLVGEPLGLLSVLVVVWRDAVWEGLSGLGARWWGRALLAGAAIGLLGGARWAALRVTEARGEPFDTVGGSAPAPINADAPMLRLVDQHGDTVGLARYAGRPVLVAFAYGHCETVCPTIVRDMLEATHRLGQGAPELLIVTLDPWRDTPARLPAIARGWGLPDRAHVLSGPIAEVERTLDAWQVGRLREASTGDIGHQRLAYLVGPSGRLVYRSDGSLGSVLSAVALATAR
jgi:protein SCO1/2